MLIIFGFLMIIHWLLMIIRLVGSADFSGDDYIREVDDYLTLIDDYPLTFDDYRTLGTFIFFE